MVTRDGIENAVVWVNHEEECSTLEILEELDTKLVHKSHLINKFNCTNLFHMRSTSHSSAITE